MRECGVPVNLPSIRYPFVCTTVSHLNPMLCAETLAPLGPQIHRMGVGADALWSGIGLERDKRHCLKFKYTPSFPIN